MSKGRPTSYEGQITLDKALEYLESCKDVFEPESRTWSINLPKSEGLALYLGVARSTIYKWAQEHEDFSDILDRINAEQANRLINNGLSGKYNANIAKLALGKQGYSEKMETDVTTKGESINVSNSEAIKLAKEYEEKLKKGL